MLRGLQQCLLADVPLVTHTHKDTPMSCGMADAQGMQTWRFAVAVPLICCPVGSRLLSLDQTHSLLLLPIVSTGKTCHRRCTRRFKIRAGFQPAVFLQDRHVQTQSLYSQSNSLDPFYGSPRFIKHPRYYLWQSARSIPRSEKQWKSRYPCVYQRPHKI